MAESADTSFHARRAVAGNSSSLEWLVERFTPLLLAQARHRLGPSMLSRVDPRDVVQQAWVIFLPRLRSIVYEDRLTPVLLKYMSTVVLRIVNREIRTRIRESCSADPADPDQLDARQRNVVTEVVRRETADRVVDAIEGLSGSDRALVIMRLIEQRPGQEVAESLGISRNLVYVRQRRALAELRKQLPASLFDPFEPD